MTEQTGMDSMNQQIPLQEYLGILLRRKRLILVVFATGLATALCLAWSQAPVYQAAAKLRVNSDRARIRVATDGSASPAFDPVNEAALSGEVALLQSVSLVREVLESFQDRPRPPAADAGLVERVIDRTTAWLLYPLRAVRQLYRRMHDIPELSSIDYRVAQTAARIQVGVIGKSNLIHVSYKAADPEWAAQFVNRLVDRHVQRYTRLNQQAEALQFFEEQRSRLSEKQFQAQLALQQLSERENVGSLTDQRAQLDTRLAEVESDLDAANIALVEATARAEFLSKAIGVSGRDASKPPSVPSGTASLVKSRILELELERSQLLSQYTPESIKVRDVDRRLAEARRLLAAEGASPSGVFAPAAEGGSLELDLARTQAEIAAVQARIEAVQKQATQYRLEDGRLDALSAEFARLEQDKTRAEAEYLNYVKAVDEAKLSHVLDDLGIVNLTVVEHAEVPIAPLSSSQWNIVILGAVLSLFAGIGLAFVRDHFDPSVKSAAQAERITGLPVLVEIAS